MDRRAVWSRINNRRDWNSADMRNHVDFLFRYFDSVLTDPVAIHQADHHHQGKPTTTTTTRSRTSWRRTARRRTPGRRLTRRRTTRRRSARMRATRRHQQQQARPDILHRLALHPPEVELSLVVHLLRLTSLRIPILRQRKTFPPTIAAFRTLH